MKKAVIFDLDGTLWDASKEVAESWTIVGRKYFGEGYYLSKEDAMACMGKTMDEIAKMITPENVEKSLAESFASECFEFERVYLGTHPGQLFENELEVLDELAKSFDLYIVSNCQSGYIETFLPIVPSGTFISHMCWSDTKMPKAFTIAKLMEVRGIKEACYVGDTIKDEEASRGAGIPFVFAAYGFGEATSPDSVAHTIKELPLAIKKIMG